MNKFYALEKSNDGTATIHLYDEVGAFGAGSKEFLADLAKLDGQHIHLRINSPGGSVVEGTAIYNALRRHKGGLTVHIDALAASMASVIAMAGAPVYIADNALLMIHNPWTISAGDSEQLRKEADLLDKLKSTLVNAYTRKTGIEQDQVAEMMNAETWFDAVEAVALGFADAIEEGVAAAATATPEMLRARFDNFAKGMTDPVVTETPEQPEVVETVEASVVSESAPEEQPPVVEEVTEQAEPVAEVAEVVEAPAEEVPEEVVEEIVPQARLTAVDSILEKFNAAIAERDAIRAEMSAIKSQLAEERETLARLERSLGLAPARVVPEIENASPESSDPVAEYLAAVESGDRKAAASLFEKHKSAIFAHRNSNHR
jgi:ATP-dependent Clp protease, protease subunit